MTPEEANEKLFDAARIGDVAAATRALDAGADVNARTEQKQTPLHWAAWHCYTDVARLLIENGADVNVRNKYQQTPLDMAAGGGNADIVDLLQAAARQQQGHARRVEQQRDTGGPQIGG